MTPQEKANALVFLYITILDSDDTKEGYMNIVANAKKCALIAVNEIIPLLDSYKEEQYWLQVKTEIENL